MNLGNRADKRVLIECWILLGNAGCYDGASSSEKPVGAHAVILSAPVAFLPLSSFRVDLTCPIQESLGGWSGRLKSCSHKRCNTSPFINSKTHVKGPKGSFKVSDHLTFQLHNL